MDALAQSLQTATRGRVIVPGDPAYDRARLTYNGMLDRRPRVIFRPTDTADIVAAVRIAGDADLGIAIRGGGHSVAGHAIPDGALVIDLSRWREVVVDPVARTADALGGSLLMDLDAATAAHGLAAPSGTYVDTGIAGLTLGGGIGYLIASEGFGCDALIGAELVTADGRVVVVDESSNPDLLWALRGGGGNFGIVTRFRFRLTSVPTVYAGVLRYRGLGVRDVLARMFEIERSAPDELVMQGESWWSIEDGAPAVTLIPIYRGDAVAGEAAIRELLDHPALYDANVHAMSWLQLQALNQPTPFGMRHYWKGHLVRETNADMADALIDATEGAGEHGLILLEPIHGAAHRIPSSSAAFGGRAATANVTAISKWADPAQDAERIEWARRAATRIEPWSLSGGGYLNYPELDQSASRVAAAYGMETFERLRGIKRAFDPENRFRYNANIPPTDTSGRP